MEILTANQIGGDAREKRNFSGHNQMKDYIVASRNDSKKLMTQSLET